MRSGSGRRAALFGVFAGLLLVGSVEASPKRDEDLRAIRDQARSIQTWVESAERPAWLDANPHEQARAAAKALADRELERRRDGIAAVSACEDLGQFCRKPGATNHRATHTVGIPPRDMPERSVGQQGQDNISAGDIAITVLVSRSLGDVQLKEIFALAADSPKTRVVFRGVDEDESLMDFIVGIHRLLAGMEPVPDVVLDPTPFVAAGTDIAPVLVAHGPNGELARVAGLADPQWLRARVLAGERGDLGVLGPVRIVTEPDLIGELQRRLAALDLDRMRERALERFWHRVGFEELPVASEPRTRRIDPTITAIADVRLADGDLLVEAGSRLNPLDQLPFTQRLVVFDATDPRQVRTARRLGREAGERRVLYLATQLEKDWEAFSTLEDALDSPVYLLTPDVRERFALQRVPATVESLGGKFLVAEVPPE
jgi:conjugal transfer pilus assembly protein TraW